MRSKILRNDQIQSNSKPMITKNAESNKKPWQATKLQPHGKNLDKLQ